MKRIDEAFNNEDLVFFPYFCDLKNYEYMHQISSKNFIEKIRFSVLQFLNFKFKLNIRIIVFVIFCLPIQKTYPESNYQHAIYQSYISGNMNKWASVITAAEKENSANTERRLELISYYYGYIGYLIGTKKK